MTAAPDALRNTRGQYASIRNRVELYSIAAEVAEYAIEIGDDPLRDPRTVSQREWNHAAGFFSDRWGRLQARQICAQLTDHEGHAYSWPKLLVAALDDSINFTQHDAQRRSKPDRTLTDQRVYWSLNQIAYDRGLRTLRPNEYEEGRNRLLIATRESRHRQALEAALPTVNQITSHCGTWDHALEIAELAPRPTTKTRAAALTVPEVITLFYRVRGYLPSTSEMKRFVEDEGLACERWQRRRWMEWIAEAVNEVAAVGLPQPNPYPSKMPPSDWRPSGLDRSSLPQRRKRTHTRAEVLEAVHEFRVQLPAGEAPTARRYKAYARGNARLPGLNSVLKCGTLASLLAEVARPDWRNQIEQEHRERQQRQAVETARREVRKRTREAVRRRRDPASRMRLLTALRDTGPLGNRDLATLLEITHQAVWKVASELCNRGLIETTELAPKSPLQRYRLTRAGLEALEDEASLAEILSFPPTLAVTRPNLTKETESANKGG